jgi:hypothetical protein
LIFFDHYANLYDNASRLDLGRGLYVNL